MTLIRTLRNSSAKIFLYSLSIMLSNLVRSHMQNSVLKDKFNLLRMRVHDTDVSEPDFGSS